MMLKQLAALDDLGDELTIGPICEMIVRRRVENYKVAKVSRRDNPSIMETERKGASPRCGPHRFIRGHPRHHNGE